MLPQWARLAWVAVLAGAAVVHLAHVVAMDGRQRWWHAGHTVMAAAMAAMYALPRMAHPSLYEAGAVLFSAGGAVLAVTTVSLWWRDRRVHHRWVLSTADFLVMAAMCAESPARLGLLAQLCAAYLTIEGLAWVFDVWGRIHQGRTGTEPARNPAVVTRTDLGARAMLATMAGGMAFMLVAAR
ncbi:MULTISPECIES: DUF5134 domain-containing protein [unclassified Amycolatopsis]|uniref:DUF5134 domain-containing protein n=1 Tax=unclassified Amycolatopsis TaxID=2618356 RepID=UPI002103F375|nr:DUF5134 domain-containing protein [Amycolatopsis sp. DSM 110486]